MPRRDNNLNGATWSAHELAALIEGRKQHKSYRQIGEGLGRTEPAVKKMAERMRKEQPVLMRLRPEPDAPIISNEAAHIRDCLSHGGFGRLPIPWNPPIKVWGRAA